MSSISINAGFPTSPSSRRAWIEISIDTSHLSSRSVALLTEGVDRNIRVNLRQSSPPGSPSSRRAWIEIGTTPQENFGCWVALLTEGVDRNDV